MLKCWKEYPHFFIGKGKTAKSVRFDFNSVIEHLKKEEYAIQGSRDMDGCNSESRVTQKKRGAFKQNQQEKSGKG